MEKLLQLVRSHPDVGPAHAVRDLAGEEGLGKVSKSTMRKLWRYLNQKERRRIFPQRAGVKVKPPAAPKFEAGTCRQCGCTDLEGCDAGCAWVDSSHTKCSECFMPDGTKIPTTVDE